MEKLQDLQLRDIYERYLREHLLGPGYAKEIFLCSDDCADEILDKKPQDLYCTGILDPKGVVPINKEIDDDLRDTMDVDEREQRAEGELGITDEDDSDEYSGSSTGIIDRNDRDNVASSHIGLITSVPENISKISIDISYAKYHQIKDTDRPSVRIRMAEVYDSLPKLLEKHDRNEKLCEDLKKIGQSASISSLITMNQDCSVQLKKFVPISIPNVMKREDGRDLTVTNQLLQKLFTERLYKRTPVFVKGYEIDLLDECETLKINEDIEIRKKVFTKAQKRYVKLLLCNINQKEYLFQARLRLSPIDGKLMTYTEPVTFARDEERATIDFVYRTVKNYGKGIGCAVEWAEDGSYIQTSYMPHSDVKKFSSAMDQQYCGKIGIDSNAINACCNLYSISHWQSDDEKLLRMLDQFVDAYGKWHEREKIILHSENQPNITENIETKQKELLDRLRDNVAYLRDNPRALRCFKLANTAMLIQMTVARDPYFRKNRDSIEVGNENNFKSLDYFKNQGQNHNYYPFQLAFLLMNIKSTFESDDPFRKDVVDMIWFPTGGGKTEAYLALTALTIIARRTSDTDEARTAGVSVVMRYTLRLLTSQQFERASYLICALEFLRKKLPQYHLGDEAHPISIGLWIGDSGRDQLGRTKKWGRFNDMAAADRFQANNPYPVTYCPWCGKRLVENRETPYGYNRESCYCINDNCFFGGDKLPIHFVDEDVKVSKPTLLFATVDKIAQLYKGDAAALFGVGTEVLPPDLIIQDELHLISGPLGSMVGFFENIVERMCTKDGRSPKIVAATATTRNTSALIKSLYNRDVRVFPAQGNTYEDNFFSHVETQSLRRHLGICPHSVPVQSEVRLISQMALARIVVIRDFLENEGIDLTNPDAVKQCLTDNGQLRSELDNFWSLVLYFNSLKDLGRARSRIAGEIHESLRVRQRYLHIPSSLDFLIEGLTSDMRIKEFTSREDSSRIKSLLTIAETPVTLNGNSGELRITSATDFVLASNMISVGIDINRWNLMMMSGQPRSTSEYIQSSSRVGRRHHGLVVNLYSPLRIREFSMYENFTSFHAAYYKFVEPLSATPVTLQILNHDILHNIVKCYKQYFFNNLPDDMAIQEVCDEITIRFHLDEGLEEVVYECVTTMWEMDEDNRLANSLRDIDQDRYIRIESINYPNR